MINKITYNSQSKSITLTTDSQIYPTYVCYTKPTLYQAIDKFDPELAKQLADNHVTLSQFIANYAK